MDYKESSLQEIIESENRILLEAEKNYGDFYIFTLDIHNLLTHFIESYDIEKFVALYFFSQIKKHYMLAIFSAIRRHHIQADMNLRQVIESGTRMAYAMGNKEQEKFYKIKEDGKVEISEKLKKASFDWIEKEFPIGSESIKKSKDQINSTTAHANLIYSFQNCKIDIENGISSFSFFDNYDKLKIKTDLRHIGNIGRGLLDLFYSINQKYNVFKLVDNFTFKMNDLKNKNNTLKNELIKTERIKKYLPNS